MALEIAGSSHHKASSGHKSDSETTSRSGHHHHQYQLRASQQQQQQQVGIRAGRGECWIACASVGSECLCMLGACSLTVPCLKAVLGAGALTQSPSLLKSYACSSKQAAMLAAHTAATTAQVDYAATLTALIGHLNETQSHIKEGLGLMRLDLQQHTALQVGRLVHRASQHMQSWQRRSCAALVAACMSRGAAADGKVLCHLAHPWALLLPLLQALLCPIIARPLQVLMMLIHMLMLVTNGVCMALQEHMISEFQDMGRHSLRLQLLIGLQCVFLAFLVLAAGPVYAMLLATLGAAAAGTAVLLRFGVLDGAMQRLGLRAQKPAVSFTRSFVRAESGDVGQLNTPVGVSGSGTSLSCACFRTSYAY